jgi:carboxymethylenebutenolidase
MMIELEAADGHRSGAYLAMPRHSTPAPRAALVVLQEVFGVNGHIRSLCDRAAALGYLGLAPSLYDRVEPGVELAYGAEGVARGREIRTQVSDEIAMRDVAAAVEEARRRVVPGGKVGVIGYCWGGTLAWLAAARLPQVAAAVGYYGSGIAGHLAESPRVPVLLHFGARDAHIPLADVEKIRSTYPEVPIHVYDAGHGFNCDERPSYEPVSAIQAQARTTTFLARSLAV